MSLWFEVSGGVIGPNDFYDLPDLSSLAEASPLQEPPAGGKAA